MVKGRASAGDVGGGGGAWSIASKNAYARRSLCGAECCWASSAGRRTRCNERWALAATKCLLPASGVGGSRSALGFRNARAGLRIGVGFFAALVMHAIARCEKRVVVRVGCGAPILPGCAVESGVDALDLAALRRVGWCIDEGDGCDAVDQEHEGRFTRR